MIPIDLLIKQSSKNLKRKDHDWQRLIQSTGQPNFLDKANTIEYLSREKERDIQRREKYLQSKLEFLNHSNSRTNNSENGGSAEQ